MANQVPVIGEAFKPYVNDQITARQKMYGSGFNQPKTPQQLTYLNSSTPWIKMASSVSVLDSTDGENRLKKLGLNIKSNKSEHLAKQAVLFNSLTPLNGNMRAGVAQSNSLINSSAYGFGGTEFGLKPLPGITNIDVTPINRGSLKQATINIKAYNKFQFELIEVLYLRLGYTVMLEWGNSIYIDNKGDIQNMDNTLIDKYFFKKSGKSHLEVLNRIEQERKAKFGNYDALFAKIVNFDWTYQPDGSYDISIKLTSLGDVVESFKVNILTPSTQLKETAGLESNSGDLTDDKVNKSTMSNFLNVIKNKYPDDAFKNPKSGVIQVNEFTPEPEKSLLQKGLSFISQTTSIESKFYVRLGTFLEYLQKEVLINMDNGNGCFPLFYINTSDECVMKSKPKLISVEPHTCITKPNFDIMGIEPPEWAENMKPFFTPKGEGNIGFIHDVYLNFAFIEKIIDSNTDKEGNLSFYSFLTAVLNGINRSLSNICDLEVTINEENNDVIIRDQKLAPRITKDGELSESEKSNIIEVTGFNNGESNFVKNFAFKTQITSKLATMLTIGASADNKSVNEDATAFSKWNSGLMDRFNQSATDGTPDKCSVKDTKTNPKSGKPLNKTLPWEIIWDAAKINLYVGAALVLGNLDVMKTAKSQKEKEFDTLKKEKNNSIDTYLQACFAKNPKKIKGGVTQDFVGNDPKANPNAVLTSKDGTRREYKMEVFDGKQYFQNDPDFITKGKTIMKNYVKVEDIAEAKKTNLPSSSIGFIPIDLSLDIMGMSGLKIYNQLLLNTDFLPYNYGKTMEFVLMGLSHKIDSSGWTTSINAIAKPKSKPFRAFQDYNLVGIEKSIKSQNE
ncbi:hypothetical protein N9145_01810 [bacterium]|nr:hypothetical protein [bacterium]